MALSLLRRVAIGILSLALINQTSLVFAQLPDAGALQQDLQQQLPLPSAAPLPDAVLPNKFNPADPKSGAVTFVVKGFVIQGGLSESADKVQEALAEWIGKRVSFKELQDACDVVVDFYRNDGYIVQAVIPPQKVVNGQVKILITEAIIGQIFVETPEGDTAFPKEKAARYITYANKPGDVLNNDQLEQALIILNEVPGVIAKSELEKGEKDGETNIRVNVTQPPQMWDAKFEANNYGSRTTGQGQGVVTTDFLEPLGIGDIITANGIFAQGSQYGQLGYALPLMPNGLRFGYNTTYLNYRNVSNYVTNGNYGNAVTNGVNLAYPVWRSQRTNLNATVNYDYKTYLNRMISDDSVASQYVIRNTYAGLVGNHADNIFGGGITNAGVTVTYGHLDISPSSPSTYSTINGVQYTPATFAKFNFNVNRNQQLANDGDTTLYLSVQGQLASGNLNSAEQFYLGGPTAVRAYPVAQSPGAQGGIGTVELRHNWTETLHLTAFFDGGLVQQYKDINTYYALKGLTNANNTYALMGAGLGATWEYEQWNFGGIIAWKVGGNPLYSNSGQAVNVESLNTQPRLWVTASYQL